MWTEVKVAVTGGNGLIGQPMVETLEREGAEVLNIDLPKYDILILPDLFDVLKGQDVCIHLAANSNVEESRKAGRRAFEVNVRGTWNVLEACLHNNVKSVVVASSNHVYGKQESFPVPETAPLNQLDTYSATKVCADVVARSYAHNYGLPVAVMRNTNCYGPRDVHTSHIVPGTITSILNGEAPVIRSEGVVKKGYLYVDDVVDAYLLVAELMLKKEILIGEVFNVGATPVSAQYVVDVIQTLMDDKTDKVVRGEPNDQHDEGMDSSKIARLGWKPKYSMEEGLQRTIEWFREQRLVRA